MKDKQYSPDWWLFLVTLMLLSFGLIMVFDASYAHAIEKHESNSLFFRKQAFSAVLGLVGLFVAARVRFWKLQPWAVASLVIAFLMLIAVRFVGHKEMGGQRWIGVGPIHLQPSEFAKLGIVLYLAKVLSARARNVNNLWKGVVPIFLICMATILLVERQPDLGTAITMLLTALLVFVAAGTRPVWVLSLLLICAIGGAAIIAHAGSGSYRAKRFYAFIDPQADPMDSGFQIIHSTIALGTGGMTGLGFGESREKMPGNLPVQHTDFIFAIIGEEFGLVGTCSVLILFILLAARGLHIAQRTKDPFGALLATGITAMISIQALVNIGVVSASIPATGVPLPFISYGGSALVPTLIGIGILLNISQYPNRVDPKPAARRRRAEIDAGADPSDVPDLPYRPVVPRPYSTTARESSLR